MPGLSHFRWLLHSNDEGAVTGSDEHAFSVNWVMPEGEFLPAASVEDSVKVDLPFWNKLDQLIWPWELTVVGWYAVDDALSITSLATTSMSPAPQDTLGIQARVKEQIQSRSDGCTTPFKMDVQSSEPPPHQQRPAFLPGEFAPLTHLPAGISADVLGMTRTLRVNGSDHEKIRWLVPELRARIDTKLWSLSPETCTREVTNANIIEVAFKSISQEDPALVAPGGAAFADALVPTLDFTFTIKTNRIEPIKVTTKATLAQGNLLNLSAQISSVASSICPLAIFSRQREDLLSPWDGLLNLWQISPIIDTTQPESDSNNYLKLSLESCLQRLMGCGELHRGVRGVNGISQEYVSSLWEQFIPTLSGPQIQGISAQRPVDGLERLVAFLRAEPRKAPMTNNADLQKSLETLKLMRQALQPVIDAAVRQYSAETTPWAPGTIGTSGSRAVIQAMGQCMADAGSARFLFAAWLAMQARAFIDVTPGETTLTDYTFDQLRLLLLEQMSVLEVSQLMVRPVLQNADAPVRVLSPEQVSAIETWTTDSTSQWEALESLYATQVLRLVNGASQSSTPDPQALSVVTDALQRCRPEINPTLPEDRDLAIRIDVQTTQSQTINQQLRGYAIALAAGYSADGALTIETDLGCDWITDVGCKVKSANGKWSIIPGSNGPKRFHETVGATREGGREVISFNYEGVAICARLEGAFSENHSIEGDPDGVLALDFFWSADTADVLIPTPPPDAPRGQSDFGQMPQLAYGLDYVVAAAPIGNAGKILADEFADAGNDRLLKQAYDVIQAVPGEHFRYLCRVAPGVPLVSLQNSNDPGQCFRYSNETRAHLHLGQQDRSAPIALIRPDDNALWKAGRYEVDFIIRGPDATYKVIERWLQADWAALKTEKLERCDELSQPSDDLKKNIRFVLKNQRDLLALMAPGSTAISRPRHPVVRAFGIEVQAFDGKGDPKPMSRYQLNPGASVESGYIGNARLTIKYGNNYSVGSDNVATMVITLPAGWFVQVYFYSLVPETFFTMPMQRMDNVGKRQEWINPQAPHYKYYYYSQFEHWFECARNPDWGTADQMFSDLLQQARVSKVDNEIRAILAPPSASAKGILTELLSGLYIERHEWHWTGYPQAFARGIQGEGKLEDWAGPFIGTESLRDDVSYRFAEQVNVDGNLCVALNEVQTLSRYRIAAEHGAKYAACLMRPIWRFEGWRIVDDNIDQVLGVGGLIAARVRWEDPALRLPPPRVKVALPLTRTFKPDLRPGATHWSASVNGSVLVLEDVLYRTDPGARFGGVSETIAVELEATRVSQVYEIGANPIFHAGPVIGQADLEAPLPYPSAYSLNTGKKAEAAAQPYRELDWGIEADAPFGLTYDLDRNAKVAQTAVIVRPTGTDVFQYWVMAKVRLRRMLDPAKEWTQPEQLTVASPTANDFNWMIRRRPEGKEWVPHDWCLDLPAGNTIEQLTIAGRTLPKSIAPTPDERGRRLIGSWHKGLWSTSAESFWGVQVMLQYLLSNEGSWKTLRTYSPQESGIYMPVSECTFDDPVPIHLARTGTVADEPTFRRVLLSDYSESHWLTFIGMPYRSLAFANEGYWLERQSNNTLKLIRTSTVNSSDSDKQREDISRDLILNPVQASDFVGDTEERIVAEGNSFHLLLLFERINDVATPDQGTPLGALKAAYKPTRAKITSTDCYPPIVFTHFMDRAPDWGNSDAKNLVGFIYRFHRAVNDGGKFPEIKNWAELVEQMFPESDSQAEAQVRWTPEFIGPISVFSGAEWKELDPGFMLQRQIQISAVVAPKKITLVVDSLYGWRLINPKAPHIELFSNRTSGACRLIQLGDKPVLELLAAGNCLLARLYDWADSTGATTEAEAHLFDADGRQSRKVLWKGL